MAIKNLRQRSSKLRKKEAIIAVDEQKTLEPEYIPTGEAEKITTTVAVTFRIRFRDVEAFKNDLEEWVKKWK